MGRVLKITTSGGVEYDATHIRLFPQHLMADARRAMGPTFSNSDVWFIGDAIPTAIAKVLTDKRVSRRFEATENILAKARRLSEWFAIGQTRIDANRGLQSVAAKGRPTLREVPKANLTFFERYVWKPLPNSQFQEATDTYGIDAFQDFIQIRTAAGERSIKLASIEAYGLMDG